MKERPLQKQKMILLVIIQLVQLIDSLPSGCYSQIVARDTSFPKLENKDSSINGSLTYNIFQKDRNDGTLQAEITGSILRGWYLFKSEGIISVRQSASKIKGNELWPGTGEVIQKNDTMFFHFRINCSMIVQVRSKKWLA